MIDIVSDETPDCLRMGVVIPSITRNTQIKRAIVTDNMSDIPIVAPLQAPRTHFRHQGVVKSRVP